MPGRTRMQMEPDPAQPRRAADGARGRHVLVAVGVAVPGLGNVGGETMNGGRLGMVCPACTVRAIPRHVEVRGASGLPGAGSGLEVTGPGRACPTTGRGARRTVLQSNRLGTDRFFPERVGQSVTRSRFTAGRGRGCPVLTSATRRMAASSASEIRLGGERVDERHPEVHVARGAGSAPGRSCPRREPGAHALLMRVEVLEVVRARGGSRRCCSPARPPARSRRRPRASRRRSARGRTCGSRTRRTSACRAGRARAHSSRPIIRLVHSRVRCAGFHHSPCGLRARSR